MPKRPKWLSKGASSLFPGNWLIRTRLLSAGLALSALSLAMPAYVRYSLGGLARTYATAQRTWALQGKIQEFSARLDDMTSSLRGLSVTHDPSWLAALEKSTAEATSTLSSLREQAKGRAEQLVLVNEIGLRFTRWTTTLESTKASARASSTPAPTHGSVLLADEPAYRIQRLLTQLSGHVHAETEALHAELWEKNHSARLTTTYASLVFLFGFTTLMLSLWYTLIPGLSELLGAARELKKGNLDYRVHLGGGSETSQLGRAFNEMAVSLKAQNEKLKELNRVKTDFVSTVSHELRTPLTAIKGSIGLILGGITGEIPSETVQMLGITQKNTDRLIRLINEVLDIAKIEAGAIQMHFDKISLVDTLNHAILGIQGFAQTSGIEVVWEKPAQSPLVVLDRDRIEQVVTNLVSNAIKFTPQGGKIAVRASWEADRVIVEVQDTGEGIPEEFLDRIFQKFQQAESAAHKAKEGTGLGLAIARAIVEEHGGSIWVQSKVGVGSTFAFSVPWNGHDFVDLRKAA